MPRPDPLLVPPGDNLRARGVSGTMMMGTTQAFRLVLQIASVVVLARLLEPEHFGLFAMVTPIVSLAVLVGDLGINQALITAKSIRQSEASTLFWCNIALAAALTVALIGLAPAIAAFFGEPAVTPIVIAMSASVLLSGLATQHLAILNRGLRFGAIAAIEITAAAIGFAAALGLAIAYPGPWALVASPIISTVVTLIGAWILSGWIPSRPGPLADVAAMLRFGGGVTGFNLANFIARNADDIIIGRAAGPAVLGTYDRAYKLLLMPLQQVSRPIGRVMLPILSQLADDPERYAAAYLRTARQIMLITLPGVVVMLMEANRLIPLLLGTGWDDAVPMFRWLAIAGLHQPLTTTMGWLFLSQQRSGEFAVWGMINAAASLTAFGIGITFIGGAVGVAQAYALTDTLLHAPMLYAFVGRKGPVRMGKLYAIAFQHMMAGTAAALAVFLWGEFLPASAGPHAIFHLMISFVLAYFAATIVIAVFSEGRRSLGESLALARGLLT